MDQNTHTAPVYGGCSLLVIFGVLVLSVFAFLSLSTAQADQRLSHASAQAVCAYYEADCQAEAIFARLRSGQLSPEVQVEGEIYSYCCPMTENQQLLVTLHFDGESWEVLRWQAVAQMDQITETMPVWDGELP